MEIFLITIAWLLGIILGLYFKIGIAFFVVFFVIIYFFRKRNKYIKFFFSKKYILLILFCMITSFTQISYLESKNSEKFKNIYKDVIVEGTIISNPISKQYTDSYILKVEKVNEDITYKNTKLILYIKKNRESRMYKYGDKILCKGEFELPEEQRNTGGFNYRKYLKTKGIYGLVTASLNNTTLKKQNNLNILNIAINKIAIKIKQKAKMLLTEKEANILLGILIGYKDELDIELQENFRKSSMSHMLAVSGAHVSYIIMIFGVIISKMNISKNSGKILTIFFLLFFMRLTNQTPSVSRACIMSIYIIIGSLLHKRTSSLCSLSFSLLIILVQNPYSIFDIGLQLSYGGTIGIILFNKYFNKKNKKELFLEKKENKFFSHINEKIKEIVKISIFANIIIIPILMEHYSTFSPTFILSNLLVSPLFATIIILGFITIVISLIFVPFSKFLAIPLGFLIKLFIQTSTLISSWKISQIYMPRPKPIFIVLYYLIIAIIIFKKQLKYKENKKRIEKNILIKLKIINFKNLFITIFIITIILFLFSQIPQNLKINFIDVGQGDSTLIITPKHKTILIDGGGKEDDTSDEVGKKILLPYLLYKGITKIDYIIISHFDTDHVGGLLTVMEELKVEQVIISKQGEDSENYQKFKEIVKKKKIKVAIVNKGDKLKIEKDLYFDILWPNKEKLISENKLNNNSIVCKLHYKSFSMLFTGDIEAVAEKKMLQEYKNNLQILNSTILKVGHHGSKTSSIQEFIEIVKPKIALIGVGKNNKFDHPNNQVIERLEKYNGRIYRTDENGEISITVNPKGKITNIKVLIEN